MIMSLDSSINKGQRCILVSGQNEGIKKQKAVNLVFY